MNFLKLKTIQTLIIFLLFGIFFILVLPHAKSGWVCGDEASILSDGYSHLLFDFRNSRHNPPLIYQAIALPLLVLKPDFPVNQKAWDQGWDSVGEFQQSFFYKNRIAPSTMVKAGRLSVFIISCMLGFLIFRWSQILWGSSAGICALILYILTPEVIANSGMAQTDIGISFFIFLSIFCFWNFIKKPTTKNFILFFIVNGLCMSAKFTAIIIFPAQFLILAYDQKKLFSPLLKKTILGWVFSVSIIVLDYGIFGVPKFFDMVRWVLGNTSGHRQWASFFFVPTPIEILWIYPAYMFFVKNPIPLLIFLIGGIILFWQQKKKYLFLLIAPAIYFILCSLSKLQVGHRALLPIYPFLIMGGGYFCYTFFKSKYKFFRLIPFVLLTWLIFNTAQIYPNYFSYFNILVGGPDQAWKYTNTDVGQNGYQILDFLNQYPGSTLITNYTLLGSKIDQNSNLKVQYFPFPYAMEFPIFSNPLTNNKEFLALTTIDLAWNIETQNPILSWFQMQKPFTTLGNTIKIYDITHDLNAHILLLKEYQKYLDQYPQYACLVKRQEQKIEQIRQRKKTLR